MSYCRRSGTRDPGATPPTRYEGYGLVRIPAAAHQKFSCDVPDADCGFREYLPNSQSATVISLLATSNRKTTVSTLDDQVDDLGHSIHITIVLPKQSDILAKPSCRERPRLIATAGPVIVHSWCCKDPRPKGPRQMAGNRLGLVSLRSYDGISAGCA